MTLQPQNPWPDASDPTLAIFKAALRTPMDLSPERLIQIGSNKVNLGVPTKLTSRRRGPKPKGTNYDRHRERQLRLLENIRGELRRRFVLPSMRTGTGYVNKGRGLTLFQILAREGVPRRKQIREAMQRWSDHWPDDPMPDESTFRRMRHLAEGQK